MGDIQTYIHIYGTKNKSEQTGEPSVVSLSPGPRSKVGPGQDSWTSGDRLPGYCGPVLPAGSQLCGVQFHRGENLRCEM